MQVEGWMITSGFVILTGLFNYVIFRTGTGKDIIYHTEQIKEIKNCVKKEDCDERRMEYQKTSVRIEKAVIRLEQKFDKYLLNGRE